MALGLGAALRPPPALRMLHAAVTAVIFANFHREAAAPHAEGAWNSTLQLRAWSSAGALLSEGMTVTWHDAGQMGGPTVQVALAHGACHSLTARARVDAQWCANPPADTGSSECVAWQWTCDNAAPTTSTRWLGLGFSMILGRMVGRLAAARSALPPLPPPVPASRFDRFIDRCPHQNKNASSAPITRTPFHEAEYRRANGSSTPTTPLARTLDICAPLPEAVRDAVTAIGHHAASPKQPDSKASVACAAINIISDEPPTLAKEAAAATTAASDSRLVNEALHGLRAGFWHGSILAGALLMASCICTVVVAAPDRQRPATVSPIGTRAQIVPAHGDATGLAQSHSSPQLSRLTAAADGGPTVVIPVVTAPTSVVVNLTVATGAGDGRRVRHRSQSRRDAPSGDAPLRAAGIKLTMGNSQYRPRRQPLGTAPAFDGPTRATSPADDDPTVDDGAKRAAGYHGSAVSGDGTSPNRDHATPRPPTPPECASRSRSPLGVAERPFDLFETATNRWRAPLQPDMPTNASEGSLGGEPVTPALADGLSRHIAAAASLRAFARSSHMVRPQAGVLAVSTPPITDSHPHVPPTIALVAIPTDARVATARGGRVALPPAAVVVHAAPGAAGERHFSVVGNRLYRHGAPADLHRTATAAAADAGSASVGSVEPDTDLNGWCRIVHGDWRRVQRGGVTLAAPTATAGASSAAGRHRGAHATPRRSASMSSEVARTPVRPTAPVAAKAMAAPGLTVSGGHDSTDVALRSPAGDEVADSATRRFAVPSQSPESGDTSLAVGMEPPLEAADSTPPSPPLRQYLEEQLRMRREALRPPAGPPAIPSLQPEAPAVSPQQLLSDLAAATSALAADPAAASIPASGPAPPLVRPPRPGAGLTITTAASPRPRPPLLPTPTQGSLRSEIKGEMAIRPTVPPSGARPAMPPVGLMPRPPAVQTLAVIGGGAMPPPPRGRPARGPPIPATPQAASPLVPATSLWACPTPSVEVDVDLLRRLFSPAPAGVAAAQSSGPAVPAGTGGATRSDPAASSITNGATVEAGSGSGSAQPVVPLLEAKRASNAGITLARYRVQARQLVETLAHMDDPVRAPFPSPLLAPAPTCC